MKKNNLTAIIGYGIVFLSVFYVIYSFSFGLENNVEELPLIYKLLGLAEYVNDDFVEEHTSQYTQVTPYVTVISLLAKTLQLQDLTFLFFILHAANIVLLYLSLRQIHKNASNTSELLILFSITFFSLILYVNDNLWIPSGRWLFINYLDPELVTTPFLFFTIAFYINKNHRLSYFYLLLATLLHPLYAIPLFLAFLISFLIQIIRRKIGIIEAVKHSIIYAIAVIPYTLFLHLQSKQSIQSTIEPSMVTEFIRAPHHFVIPPFSPSTFLLKPFLLYVITFSAITFIIWKYLIINSNLLNYDVARLLKVMRLNQLFIQHEENTKNITNNRLPENLVELIVVNLSLVSLLLLTSFISGFVRISLLVNLTVYRVGLVVVTLTWIILVCSFLNKLEIKEYRLNHVGKLLLRAAIVIVLLLSLSDLKKSYATPERSMSSTQKEVVSWVKGNTNSSDLFLSYVDFDIRTSCLRSSYFEFKTIPLTADGQILWYERYLNYLDVPKKIAAQKYHEVAMYAESQHQVDISHVVANSGVPIKYILISKLDVNRSYAFSLKNFKCVFENDAYQVYYRLS